MSDIPNHEITTPVGKHKVVLKDFISGYDDEAIEAIYTRGRHEITPPADGDVSKMEAPKMAIEGSAIQDAEREGVKRVVLSVDGANGDGKDDGIVELVYTMRKEDARYVKSEVDKIINPPAFDPAKKK